MAHMQKILDPSMGPLSMLAEIRLGLGQLSRDDVTVGSEQGLDIKQ
jgi:hypothetical protein